MRSVKFAALAAAVCVGLGVTAASAADQQVASVQTCLSLATQVKTALEANAQSPNYDDAVKEKKYGLEFCNASFYAKGVSHYDRALQLLGVSDKADAAMSH
jgi:hypothetical protein